MTNRPAYDAERARHPLDSVRDGDRLVLLAIHLDDVRIIAAALETGASAFSIGAGLFGLVDSLFRRRAAELSRAVAGELIEEATRIRARAEYRAPKPRKRKAAP